MKAGRTGPHAWLLPGPVDPEQARHLLRVTPTVSVLSNLAAAVAIALVEDAQRSGAYAWFALFTAVTLLRVAYGLWTVRHEAGERTWRRRGCIGVALSLLHLAIWGALGPVLGLQPGAAEQEAMLHVVVAAVALGAAVHLSSFFRVLMLGIALTLVPVVLRDLLIGGRFHQLLAFQLSFIFAYTLLIGHKQFQALTEVFSQRRRNAALVEELRHKTAMSEAARRAAEDAIAARTRFFAAANHDLRQPLHALGLMVQAVRGGPPQAPTEDIVQHMQECVDGMGQVVDALMEITRVDSAAAQPQWRAIALDRLVDEACAPYRALAERKGLGLETAVGALGVRSDRQMLWRVIANLVSNGVRYTPAGRVRVTATATDDGRVRLRVEDSGIGIAPEHVPRIFDEFYQAGNPARDRRLGLGLGLAIVKRFTEQLGIEMALQTAPGRGVTVDLWLPACAPPAAEAPSAGTPAVPPLPAQRVLVIEDDAESRHALATLLESWGCSVAAAVDAPQALALLADGAQAPQAMIVDLRLAGGASGLDAVHAVWQRLAAPVPALIVTGDAGSAQAQAAATAGLPVLLKPAKPMQLRAFLAQAQSAPPA